MAVTAGLVKDLRERTGAGMMDCKKALEEAAGDIEAAIDWLRKKGLSAAAKKAGRTAAEGLVGVYTTGTKGAVIEVNAETDFVGRNETFQTFVRQAAELALTAEADIEKMNLLEFPSTNRSVAEELSHLVATVGENMMLRRAEMLSVSEGVIASYIHNAVAPHLGRLGVLVALESTGDSNKLQELGKQIAMHIAAANPQSATIEDLDPQVIAKEREFLIEQARASGRTDDVIEKMIDGRMRKFYEQSVLLEQTYIMDGERQVRQVIEDKAKEIGASIQLKGFVRFAIGEGIEKKDGDFAAEVAATLGQ
jgi:elongation factor Ts